MEKESWEDWDDEKPDPSGNNQNISFPSTQESTSNQNTENGDNYFSSISDGFATVTLKQRDSSRGKDSPERRAREVHSGPERQKFAEIETESGISSNNTMCGSYPNVIHHRYDSIRFTVSTYDSEYG